MAKLPKAALQTLARMGGEIRAHGYVIMEQHEFIQDVYLDGQGGCPAA
jgi:hypothetical protein